MDNGDGGQYGSTGETQNNVSSKKLQQTHAQVNEVVDIMRDNVEKVIDRDVKLSELDDRADALQQGASQFETQAAKLKRKYWWKNMKMWIILGVLGLLVGGVFILNKTSGQQPPFPQYNPYMPPPGAGMPGAPGQVMGAAPGEAGMMGAGMQEGMGVAAPGMAGVGEAQVSNGMDMTDNSEQPGQVAAAAADDSSSDDSSSSDNSAEDNSQTKRLWNDNYRTMSRRNLEDYYRKRMILENQRNQYNPGYNAYYNSNY